MIPKDSLKKEKAPNDLVRAKSAKELQDIKFKVWPFSGKWADLLGEPQTSGCWLIWGPSFNGKTSFVFQLCRYLASFEKVLYNSLEEGWCKDTQDAVKLAGLDEVGKKFHLLHKEPIEDLVKRLEKHKSANVVVIDSLQYADINLSLYKSLRARFPKKLFIIISHADGKEPEGRVAKKIKYDAAKKIRIEGFRALSQVRGKGMAHYDIWDKGAAEYWNELS
ncbi:hypothetical protein [Pedobacter sp. ASV28]|jgi:hypothetical protein|uniref:hypothetical protein n=1 Tax=Pedobacter sp. ASV28 TaxID=2795123 RepID=UPI0018ED29A9|nr:hypothetical protein [Pedobacter sp. ASV28]